MTAPARHPDTLVIMPAWNESESIGNTIREVFEFGPPCDVLVVDDGSRDGTARVAREAGATVLQLPFNMGVGGAMRTGFKYAKSHGYKQVIQVDADGQHDPRDIKAVLDGLQHADIAIGARFADKGNYTVRGPRKWAMKVLAWTISRIAGTPLTDVTSGFRAANIKAIRQYVDHYPAEYLGDTIDSLVVAIRSGCTVRQVAVSMRARQGGTPSHDPMKAAIYLGRSGMALLFALTRKKTEPSTN
ncbi:MULTISPECIES: glycosyltransferase family 2 protein [unclassified Arthrobacter]|uniref:glycosyltransferase family 2 protein n=1 Tax=unclassified Arthrobacter TaxID=235627 RepID=UPI0009D288A0|nr:MULTISPECIES: glycosyltransferase family 2 protein [unclassified Arthrobacter]MDF2050299.1 glycosyltransferase family 2 protein [Arthrobacter sp. Cr_A7]SLK05697.1 Glycosyltransferase involved in cell wall bisynthesis [Arthrobacter sp. P2b]